MTLQSEELAVQLRTQLLALDQSFREIPGRDRQRPITPSQHPGGSSWSATDHLAHIVESEWGFLAIGRRLVAADPDPTRLSRRGNTPTERDALVNSENQTQVESRRGQSFEDLIDELRRVSEQRVRLLHGLSNDQLARPVPGAQRAEVRWAALLGSTRHAQAHLEMVQQSLAAANQ
jgi:hypothetical protein